MNTTDKLSGVESLQMTTRTIQLSLPTISNLSSRDVGFNDVLSYPHSGYPDISKDEWRRKLTSAKTNHLLFSNCVGIDPNKKVNSTSNPLHSVNALIADFDADVSDMLEVVIGNCTSSPYCPTAISRTFSGGMRMVWMFDEPVIGIDTKHYPAVISRLLKKVIKANTLAPGLDESVISNPSQFYELGVDWRVLNHDFFPTSLVHDAIAETFRLSYYTREVCTIPMETIAEEVENRFPGKWNGEFREGARGTRFWDPQADASSVIVTRGGCVCFTGDKPFMSWADIFGQTWVSNTESDRRGKVLEQFFFDKSNYWWKTPSGKWEEYDKGNTVIKLRSMGFSATVGKGQTISEVDRIRDAIHESRGIFAAAPIPFCNCEVVDYDGKKILNLWDGVGIQTDHTKSLDWDSPEIQNTREFLDNVLGLEQTPYAIAWLARAHQAAVRGEGKDTPGQAIFIAGKAESGKTFFTNWAGKLLGGVAQVADYFLGGDPYTAKYCRSGLWVLDDDRFSERRGGSHASYTATLKKVVANRTIQYNEKFMRSSEVPWWGRIIFVCNDDPESLRILPNVGQSILDKVMMFHVPSDSPILLKAQADKVMEEIPAFSKFLLDYVTPEEIACPGRFGVKPYHNQNLLETAQENSFGGAIYEMIEEWRKGYFLEPGHTNLSHWEGTVTALLGEFQSELSSIRSQSRSLSKNGLSRALTEIISQHPDPWVRRKKVKGVRVVEVNNPYTDGVERKSNSLSAQYENHSDRENN